MVRNLLETCRDIAQRVGLPRPSAILSDEGALAPQYYVMLLETAQDLMRRCDWQVLEMEGTFNTVAGDVQVVNLLASYPDFRRIKEDTVVNVTRAIELKPMSRRAQALSRITPTVLPGYRYRIRGNQFIIPGNTNSDEEVIFEYISSGWVSTSDNVTRKTAPTLDTDLLLLDDEALVLGAKWRFKKENGLEYGEDFNDYEKYVQELIGSDSPRETLSMSGPRESSFIGFEDTIVIG